MNYNFICIMSVIFLVSGCQSESNKESTSIDKFYDKGDPIIIEANDMVLRFHNSGQPKIKEISENIYVSDGGSFYLEDIRNLSKNNCKDIIFDDSQIELNPNDFNHENGVCNYRYTVNSHEPLTSDSVTSALIRIAPFSNNTSATLEQLPPIGIGLLISDDIQEIDIPSLLSQVGEDVSDFTISNILSHAYPYFGGAQISTDSGRILYTTAQTSGIDRILFSYENVTSKIIKLGSIDIVVSNEHNKGLSINSLCYHDEILSPNVESTIDISQCVSVDHDSNDYGLSEVESFYATTNIASSNSFEKHFKFKSSLSRHHYVNFVVDDSKGGIELGQIKITVGDAKQLPGWEDIEIDELQRYSAPKTALESVYSDITYSEALMETEHTTDLVIQMAGYYPNEASDYCSVLGGRLPTSNELIYLTNHPLGSPNNKSNWPVQMPYLAKDQSNFSIVNLKDGQVSSPINESAYYVTCRKGDLVIEPLTSRCAFVDSLLEFNVNAKNINNESYSNEYIGMFHSSSTASFTPKQHNDNYLTNDDGQFSFGLRDTVPGEIQITAKGATQTSSTTKAEFKNMSIRSAYFSTAAISGDGVLLTWGNGSFGGDSSTLSPEGSSNDNIKEIFTSSGAAAFAALKNDGTVIAWGAPSSGGDLSTLSPANSTLSNVETIVSNNNAFAALKSDGSVVVWGDVNKGGDASTLLPLGNSLNNIKQIIPNSSGSFAAITNTNEILVWGDSGNSGDLSVLSPTGSTLDNVKSITANNGAFAALKNDGTVVAWGDPLRGGNTSILSPAGSSLTDIVQIFAHPFGSSFVALKSDGSIVAWGDSLNGGDLGSNLNTNILSVYANGYAFAAIRSDGTVFSWGAPTSGGDGTLNVTVDDAQMIAVTLRAFAALKNDGTVVTWGVGDSGGDASSLIPEGSILEDVINVVGTTSVDSRGAFAAHKEDGSVVVWGNNLSGANMSTLSPASSSLTDIYDIIPNATGFTFLKRDGTLVSLGTNVQAPAHNLLGCE